MSIFSDRRYLDIEKKVRDLIGKEKTFLSTSTVNSTRAIGDAIENIISTNFESVVAGYCKEYY